MRVKHWHLALIAAVALSAWVREAQAQTVACAGLPAWVATTTYASGSRVTYQGGLYQAVVATTNVPPSYCPACGWWQLVGTCGTGPTCSAAPGAPTGLSSPGQTTSSVTLTWSAATAGSGCTVSYRVFQDGVQVATPTASGVSVGGLSPGTLYAFTVAAVDSAGTSAQSGVLSVRTLATSGGVTSGGTVDFHLLLGVSGAADRLALAGDRYTDLIMSNLIAGVMEGHLIQAFHPGLQYDRDYLYGSIMAQLLQENLATNLYTPGQDLIDPAPEQQAVMGQGQGGPYQINNYAVDMVAGTYAPGGYALVNFVALQKNLGYTMAGAATQYTRPTPASFNDKYFSPMLTAYFHYVDLVALYVTGKGEWGWTTPWEPAFDDALSNFETLPGGFLETILNVAYNQGFYGGLVASYSRLGATATPATVTAVRSYASVWGKTSTYEQYPYQVMYYLDQLYGNPVPTTSPTTLVAPGTHVAFGMDTLGTVFSRVFQKLAYVNASGQYVAISSSQAGAAFSAGLSAAGVAGSATLDLATATDRARIFAVLETAVQHLEASLGTRFDATTSVQL